VGVFRRDDRFECEEKEEEERAPTPNPSPQREDALGEGSAPSAWHRSLSALVSRASVHSSLALMLRSRAAQASLRSLRKLGCDARRLEA
jgi:hypothetical protein